MRGDGGTVIIIAMIAALSLGGCGASYQFYDAPHADAVTYRESVPYVEITRGADCSVQKFETVSVPGPQRSVAFNPGMGGGALSVGLKDGVMTSIGETAESSTAPLISAAAGAASAAAPLLAGRLRGPHCQVGMSVYPVRQDGKPDLAHPLKLN